MKLTNDRMHQTPADKVLHRDRNGTGRKSDFNYRSIIGQLNYLTSSTRPDIQLATHQCARFCNEPKNSHEVAVKRIIRYLKQTKNEGIIMKPDKNKAFECYVDADFAGGYKEADATDPASVLSRTGYVITYADCPVIWSSKMQTTISLSTTEAEYIALSSAMCDVIYLLNLTKELSCYGINVPNNKVPNITCQVFEDNVGTLELANNPNLRPRAKHLAVQLHHFQQYTLAKRITVEHVKTQNQLADTFIKPLPCDTF